MSTRPEPPPSRPATPPVYASRILSGTALLVLLYFGREVLVPITLAAILGLLFAPLVRLLKRTGLGQVPAVLGAVAVPTLCVLGLALVIGSQLVSMAASLPQYESTIRAKVRAVRELTLGRMELMQGEAGRMMRQLGEQATDVPRAPASFDHAPLTASGAVPVEIHERAQTPVEVMSHAFSAVWGPLGKAGVVLVLLLFILLEHEALRDRFIRLLGGSDLRGTTHAFNDAGERLSRFFVSQFAVNVGVGLMVWGGLAVIGLPHGLLWAVLTTVLRFVPYVGVFVAAGSAGLLAAAVDPGWTLVLLTMGLFTVVEVVAAQVVEPQLYGHSTGLSPLSVVVAAIFWSWIWGPIGLLVSTPLTLCLVVAGRHIEGLRFLDLLLGDTPALTMSERFYQRALSGDADEIIAAARKFLQRKSFARYCDAILMPALNLTSADLAARTITPEQQMAVKGAVAQVIEALGPDERKRSRWHRHTTVLDDANVGVHLRHQREAAIGKWQGPLSVAPGSLAMCVGLGSMRDDLVTEILVRILRDLDIDARHISLDDVAGPPPAGATPGSVAMVFLVSALPTEEWERGIAVADTLRRRFSQATLVGMMQSDLLTEQERQAFEDSVDLVAHSFEEAVAHAQVRYPVADRKQGRPAAR